MTTKIWKMPKNNNGEQKSIKMEDMTKEEIEKAIEHCLEMLHSQNFKTPGRYLILKELKEQYENIYAELTVRYFLTTYIDNKPLYTRITLANKINQILKEKDIDITLKKNTNLAISDIMEIDSDYSFALIKYIIRACNYSSGVFNNKYLSKNFLFTLGLWFDKEDKNYFEKVENITNINDKLNVIKERLDIKPDIKLLIKPDGLSYHEFKSLYNIKYNTKYSDLTTLQLKTLINKVLYKLEIKIHSQMALWEELLKDLLDIKKDETK